MRDFIAAQDRALLEQHDLASFDTLWALKLEAVDEPNTERGGWSTVYRLQLDEHAYYLKRQSNHLTRTLLHPFGEPTFAREFRNIRRYAELRIPALQAAFFAERSLPGERRAVLLTRALDGWLDLDHWLRDWSELEEARRNAIVSACGILARRLHEAGQIHGCFYPKHIFLREQGGEFEAQLIDLEKTRPLLLGRRDRVKDIEPLFRRTGSQWEGDELQIFLQSYLRNDASMRRWLHDLSQRKRYKSTR